jgi:hypothetical protein
MFILVGMFADFPVYYMCLCMCLQELISLSRNILPSLFTFKPLEYIKILNIAHKDINRLSTIIVIGSGYFSENIN